MSNGVMKRSGAPQTRAAVTLKRIVMGCFAAALMAMLVDFNGWLGAQAAPETPQDEQNTQTFTKTTRDDCAFLKDPETLKTALARHREEVSRATENFRPAGRAKNESAIEAIEAAGRPAGHIDISLVSPTDIPRKNFIDNILFDRMGRDGVQSAPIATDEEFIRRAYLDITGRIPMASAVTSFLADTNPNKRDALVDSLVGTPEYVDKWTMFFGDLFRNTARATNVQRYTGGRDAFHTYIKNSIAANKSYAQMATEMITSGTGTAADNFVNGEANFMVGGTIPMGPPQDTMDGTAVNTMGMFLGINALDCLLCHNGERHLDAVNLWGSQRTRYEAFGMAAFFSRVRRQRQNLSTQPNYAKFLVSELPNGEYQLNTNSGNRQTRDTSYGASPVQPRYILGGAGVNAGENRRQAVARLVTSDKQFARAAVNYIWEKLMVEALVSPSNTFDPARLDPKAILPSGWTVQPANPELLEALADEFIRQNYDLKKLIALIAKSSAYQLSSQYPGSWNLTLVPYYARKFVRRLDAEEIHDAILRATSIGVTYQMRDTLNANTFTVNWAMQLPDTAEPRGVAQSIAFLNSFVRGDRDIKPRSQEPTIQQALNLMNSQFVMSRIHNANAGSTVQTLLANAALTNDQIITQLFLSTLSRNPTQAEKDALTPLYSTLSKTEATQTIQWSLLNKSDFIFNY
ncbi:MAG: DUF1549 domain-containing protein [Blastocatellia bacterium]